MDMMKKITIVAVLLLVIIGLFQYLSLSNEYKLMGNNATFIIQYSFKNTAEYLSKQASPEDSDYYYAAAHIKAIKETYLLAPNTKSSDSMYTNLNKLSYYMFYNKDRVLLVKDKLVSLCKIFEKDFNDKNGDYLLQEIINEIEIKGD